MFIPFFVYNNEKKTGRNLTKTKVIKKVWSNNKNTLPYEVVFHLQHTRRNQMKMKATNEMLLFSAMLSQPLSMQRREGVEQK